MAQEVSQLEEECEQTKVSGAGEQAERGEAVEVPVVEDNLRGGDVSKLVRATLTAWSTCPSMVKKEMDL